MKRSYESMDAFKVAFNANEQVAAACSAYDDGSKYNIPDVGMKACDLDANSAKYVIPGVAENCFFTDDGAAAMGVSTKYQS